MSRTMITFKEENFRFIYRVVGVAIHDGHVLLEANSLEIFWNLPEGRAELGESATKTLVR